MSYLIDKHPVSLYKKFNLPHVFVVLLLNKIFPQFMTNFIHIIPCMICNMNIDEKYFSFSVQERYMIEVPSGSYFQ